MIYRDVKLAEDESGLIDSLFAPGGTMDGHIVKRTVNSLTVFYKGQEHKLNSFGCSITLGFVDCMNIADQYCKSFSNRNGNRIYRFK